MIGLIGGPLTDSLNVAKVTSRGKRTTPTLPQQQAALDRLRARGITGETSSGYASSVGRSKPEAPLQLGKPVKASERTAPSDRPALTGSGASAPIVAPSAVAPDTGASPPIGPVSVSQPIGGGGGGGMPSDLQQSTGGAAAPLGPGDLKPAASFSLVSGDVPDGAVYLIVAGLLVAGGYVLWKRTQKGSR